MAKLTPYIQALDCAMAAAAETDFAALDELVHWVVTQAETSEELEHTQIDDLRGLSGLGGRVGCGAVAGYLMGVEHNAKEALAVSVRNALGGALGGMVPTEQDANSGPIAAVVEIPTGQYL